MNDLEKHTDSDKTNRRLVGQPVPRLEDDRLLTGRGRYVDDRQVVGALHVAFLRSDQAHAAISRIDAEEALQMPGVFGVFTAEDLEGVIKPAIATSRMADYHSTPIYALAKGKVRYVGEPIVAVLADDRYLAEDARDVIEIVLEPLPVATNPEEAAKEGAPLLHDEAKTNVLVKRAFIKGDVDESFSSAVATVGGRFRFHRKTSVAMEPRTYLAEIDVGKDAITLYSSTQVPGIVRDALAELLDMPGSRMTVIAPDVGGGFGGKTSLYQEEMLVCALARKLGRPVRWTSDRMEDLIATSQGFDEIVDAELAVDSNGAILGLRARVTGDIGAYSIYPWTAGIEPVQVISFLPGPYRVSNYSASVQGVSTPKAPTGPYRGVGRPISTFVMERLVDMAARKLGIDPVEMRLRNLVQPSEFPYKTAVGIVWDRSAFIEGLEAARDQLGYQEARKLQADARREGRLVGIGIASYAELSGIGSRISASPGMPINTGTDTCVMRVDSTGAISAAFGCASHGQGHETTLAQVVADELGAKIRDVQIITGNTSTVPHGTGTFASRTAVLSSGAAMLAARELRARMVRVAAFLLDGTADEILVAESAFHLPRSDKRLTFVDLAKALYSQMGRVPAEFREDLSVTKSYDPIFGTTSSSTHMALVEVDPETCFVQIKRYIVAEDCGRIINPLIVDGQTRGAVAQGVGAALFEEVVYDANGQVLTASLVDYVIPSAPEVPNLEIVHLETEAPSTMGGIRGMGEGGTIGAPAAIANAIADALSPFGIEVFELPATPDRIFKLVNAARQRPNSN